MLREPLVLPVGAIAIGIVLGHLWPIDAPQLLLAAALAGFLTLIALWRGVLRAGVAACLPGFLFCGALLEQAHRPPTPPRLDVPDLSMTILSGCVVQPPVLVGDKEQFVLELGPHARARVSMFAHPGETLPALRYGQQVDVEGLLRLPRNFGNPDAFDYRNYLARQDIFWTLGAQRLTVNRGSCGSAFDRTIATIRTAALDRISSLYNGDPYNTAMMDAVLMGEGSGLERIWTERYRSTGTFHALVISGSHVAVLAGTFLFLLRLCFVPRLPATLLVVLAAWLYAVVTGWQAPVIRSAAGMSVFAIGSLFFRDRRLLNLLAGVALFFLLIDPDQIFDPSFQLSFLAVAFLAVFAVPIVEHTSGPLARAASDLGDRGRDVHLEPAVAAHRVELRLYAQTLNALVRLPERASLTVVVLLTRVVVFFYELFITSAAVQAGLALPMAIYFHRVSFTGLSANAVVVPLLGLVVPIGFAAVFTGAHWLAATAALLLDLSRRTVDWHAALEPNWRIPQPPVILSLLICVALVLAAVRWRSGRVRWAIAGVVVVLLGALIVSPFQPHLHAGMLEMTAIDVGQGDSIFVGFPDGKTMLMDAGGIPSFAHREPEKRAAVRMEIGEDVVAPYLWTRALRKIDVAAISHLHDDHVGGLPAILQDFEVKELWVGAATPACEIWGRVESIARARGIRIRRLHAGDAFTYGNARVEILAPAPDYIAGPTPGNNDSLVMRVQYRDRSFLLTGDMERDVEVAARWPHADVLKVGHHGSKTSSTSEFLDEVHPALAVISDGHGNMYGHPHPITLQALRDRHVLLYRTDQDGAVTILTDGRRVWRE